MSTATIKKMKTKSALSYFGSDSEVAEDIAAYFNKRCKHVAIGFCGGLSLLPWLDAKAIVANDLNDLAINFYHTVNGAYGDGAAEMLIWRCETTLSHPAELKRAKQFIHSEFVVERAWGYWAQCWLARKGTGGTKRAGEGVPSMRKKADGGNNATRITAAAGDLKAWAQHFKRCEFTCEDFREFLAKRVADDETCGLYLDPPWIDAGDDYLHAFKLEDHIDLRAAVDRFKKTRVLVRYGDHPKIRELYAGWHILERVSRDQSNRIKPELWITNQPWPEAAA